MRWWTRQTDWVEGQGNFVYALMVSIDTQVMTIYYCMVFDWSIFFTKTDKNVLHTQYFSKHFPLKFRKSMSRQFFRWEDLPKTISPYCNQKEDIFISTQDGFFIHTGESIHEYYIKTLENHLAQSFWVHLAIKLYNIVCFPKDSFWYIRLCRLRGSDRYSNWLLNQLLKTMSTQN